MRRREITKREERKNDERSAAPEIMIIQAVRHGLDQFAVAEHLEAIRVGTSCASGGKDVSHASTKRPLFATKIGDALEIIQVSWIVRQTNDFDVLKMFWVGMKRAPLCVFEKVWYLTRDPGWKRPEKHKRAATSELGYLTR